MYIKLGDLSQNCQTAKLKSLPNVLHIWYTYNYTSYNYGYNIHAAICAACYSHIHSDELQVNFRSF